MWHSVIRSAKTVALGGARDPHDKEIFHKLSLIAFFAWVGLGSDGLSSSCYGPQETFLALGGHIYLGVFVALACGLTVFVISASYSQIIELFPEGGGGYLVATKLLSPTVGMVSGCALLIDYVLTIALSIASGSDAIFSFLPLTWMPYKIVVAISVVILLTYLNMRGVKESVVPLVPIFLLFVGTHVFVILYAVVAHAPQLSSLASHATGELHSSVSQLGLFGAMALMMRAYSMGAGTYTGIEAVSNGLPILREPRVRTAKHTMRYMATSLALMVVGLMFAYLLYEVKFEEGKTLNAVLFEHMTATWPGPFSHGFVLVTLITEAAILFVAAQTGFLDGPRVMANMALDRWLPTRFATLSDRLVTQNGILLMGGAALILLYFSRGSVDFLVVLYSINVFITFVLSQTGMVRHWWQVRGPDTHWKKGLALNGFGLALTSGILVFVVTLKFNQGGWITLLVTGALIVCVVMVRRHYNHVGQLLGRLNSLVQVAESSILATRNGRANVKPENPDDGPTQTAVILVNGYNGLGLHTLFGIIRTFPSVFRRFVFIQVGIVDAGAFKGPEQIEALKEHMRQDTDRYVTFMRSQGYEAEALTSIGADVLREVVQLGSETVERYPSSVVFAGQLVFGKPGLLTRFLHNYIAFALQREFHVKGISFVILPIRI